MTTPNDQTKKPQPSGRGSGQPHLILLPDGNHMALISRTQCALMLNKMCQLKTGIAKGFIDPGYVKSLITMNMAIPEGPLAGYRVFSFDSEEAMLRKIMGLPANQQTSDTSGHAPLDTRHSPLDTRHSPHNTYHAKPISLSETEAESEVKSEVKSEVLQSAGFADTENDPDIDTDAHSSIGAFKYTKAHKAFNELERFDEIFAVQ